MADYGMRARNGENFLQIDGAYTNYRFRERRTVTTIARYGNLGNFSYAEVGISGGASVRPVIAHKNAFYTQVMGPTANGADSFAWVAVEGGVGTTFDIWIFDSAPPVNTPGDYGLRVKKADWGIAFNSQLDWFKPVSEASGFPSSNQDPGNLYLPGAVDLGIVQMVSAFQLVYLNLPPGPGGVRFNIGHWPLMHRRSSINSIFAAYQTVGQSGPFTGSAATGGSKLAYGFMGVELNGL